MGVTAIRIEVLPPFGASDNPAKNGGATPPKENAPTAEEGFAPAKNASTSAMLRKEGVRGRWAFRSAQAHATVEVAPEISEIPFCW